MSDPRVFFAAERTILAWVRSGLTVIALGFVVARLGLLLTLLTSNLALADTLHVHRFSTLLGIVLVLVGTGIIVGALHNHRRYIGTLPPEDIPKQAVSWLVTFFSLSVALVGICLAAYLAIT